MSKYIATVIKTGNSYALRVPKGYVDDAKLKLGQKIRLSDDFDIDSAYNHDKFIAAVKELQRLQVFKDIKDPVAWQRKIRKEWDRPLPGRD